MMLNNDDLRRFFADVLKEHGLMPTASMRIMGALIRLTIDYRDQWLKQTGETLTVDETRQALDIYTRILNEETVTEVPNRKIAGLVAVWLREINGRAFTV